MNKSPCKVLVGVFPLDLETVLLSDSQYFEPRYLVAKGTYEEKWAKQFLPKSKTFLYSLPKDQQSLEKHSFTTILRDSNVTSVMKKNGIRHLWITVENSDREGIYRVALKNKIEVIGPGKAWQRNLENKIWFDKFLEENNLSKPKSQIFTPARDKIKIRGKLVLQKAISDGGEGTYFLNDKRDVGSVFKKHRLERDKKYLLREFVFGRPCGITVLVSPRGVALSAIREQRFLGTEEYQPHFAGIQWIASSEIKKSLSEIKDVFMDLGEILRKRGFVGFANVDFIIDSFGKVKIIECNPRFSSSTMQLTLMPQLIGGLDAPQIIIEGYLGKSSKDSFTDLSSLTRSKYRGAVLNLDINNKKTCEVIGVKPVGLYKIVGGNIKFVSPDVRKMKREDEFIFFTMVSDGEKYKVNRGAGSITANFPLFGASGKLNREGRVLTEYFKYDCKKS